MNSHAHAYIHIFIWTRREKPLIYRSSTQELRRFYPYYHTYRDAYISILLHRYDLCTRTIISHSRSHTRVRSRFSIYNTYCVSNADACIISLANDSYISARTHEKKGEGGERFASNQAICIYTDCIVNRYLELRIRL